MAEIITGMGMASLSWIVTILLGLLILYRKQIWGIPRKLIESFQTPDNPGLEPIVSTLAKNLGSGKSIWYAHTYEYKYHPEIYQVDIAYRRIEWGCFYRNGGHADVEGAKIELGKEYHRIGIGGDWFTLGDKQRKRIINAAWDSILQQYRQAKKEREGRLKTNTEAIADKEILEMEDRKQEIQEREHRARKEKQGTEDKSTKKRSWFSFSLSETGIEIRWRSKS